MRDTESGAPLRRSDHVRIASITKSYVATEVLRQVDRGRLRLSDTIDGFVSGVPDGDQITIAQLLGMRAGTYDFTMDAAFGRRFAANPRMGFGVRDVLRIIGRHRPSFRPGARVQYSDTNYTLLGVVLEKVTGRSPEAVIKIARNTPGASRGRAIRGDGFMNVTPDARDVSNRASSDFRARQLTPTLTRHKLSRFDADPSRTF